MLKHRLAFSKADAAKFTSHLDLMRILQRSFPRVGVAIRHTEGSNSHALVSTPLPLSVGFSSEYEVLGYQVLDTPPGQVPAKMNVALPTGITIQRRYEAVRSVEELCYVNYIVTLEYEAGVPLGVENAIRDLLVRDCLVMTKRSRKAESGFTEVDLIPLIAKTTVEGRWDIIALDPILRAQSPGLNPELVVTAIWEHCPGAAPDFVIFHRRAVLNGQFQAWEQETTNKACGI